MTNKSSITAHQPVQPSDLAAISQTPAAFVITNIQAMRGIASLMVFFAHLGLLNPGMGLDPLFPYLGVVGSSGVDIFFVISGFIITTVAVRSGRNSLGRRGSIAWNFGVKRLTRIYPVYWIVFALAFALSPFVKFAPNFVPRMPILQQFLLLTHVNSLIMAAWSLAFEVYFYAIVTVALWASPRRVSAVLAVWAVSVSAIIIYDTFAGHGWTTIIPLSPLVMEFIFGLVIAFAIERRLMRFAVTAVVLGIIGYLVGLEIMRLLGWYTLPPWWRTLCSGVPSAFIIYGVVALELNKGWKFASFWSVFGDASYSIYIWHQFLLYSMLKICQITGLLGSIPSPILLLVWMGFALAFGFFSYHKIELPLQSALNLRLIRRSADGLKSPVSSNWSSDWKRHSFNLVCVSFLTIMLGIGIYSSIRTAHNREAISAADSVAKQILSLISTKHLSLANAAEAIGFRPDPELVSGTNGIYNSAHNRINAQGWAADTIGRDRGLKILMFRCGHYLGCVIPRKRRPDVASVLRTGNDRYGFNDFLPNPADCDSTAVEGLIITKDRAYSIMSGEIDKQASFDLARGA